MAIYLDLTILKLQNHLHLEGDFREVFPEACKIVSPYVLQEFPTYAVDCRMSDSLLILNCRVVGKMIAPCDLCLEDVVVKLDYTVEQVFSLAGSMEDEDIINISPSLLRLDIAPVILDGLVCDLPFKVVCSDECKGLCPQCGGNLNLAQCSCRPIVDSRWSKLAEYKDRESGK